MSQDKTERMEYFISLLDDYIDGKLDTTQTDEIKQALAEDPFLSEVLRQHVQARANMRAGGEEELRKKFADSFDPIPEEPVAKPSILRYVIPIILLAGLAAASYYYFSSQQEEPPRHIANEESNEESFLLANLEDPQYDLLRSDKDSLVDEAWRTSVQSFIANDYTGTLENLSRLELDSVFLSQHLGKYNLMKGVSNLKLEKFDAAIEALSNIGSENPYFDQAEWYLAMVHFYANNTEAAKKNLTTISNNNSHYKRKAAKKYLEKL